MDIPLRIADIEKRYAENARGQHKDTSDTPKQYLRAFRKFADAARIEDYTKRQLDGPKGKLLLMGFLTGKHRVKDKEVPIIPQKSKRWYICALQSVWTYGLDLTWPLDVRRDFRKTLPPIGRRGTPRDADAEKWLNATRKEPDEYTRALVLYLICYGFRDENQLGHLKRRNLRRDDSDRMYAIHAKGADEDFKTFSDIVAYMPPEIVEATEAVLRHFPSAPEEAPLFPWRDVRGHVPEPMRPLDARAVRALVKKFEERWHLTHIAPAEWRHWVKWTLIRMGLRNPGKAHWQGHSPKSDDPMDGQYATPGIEGILDQQMQVVPRGPMGFLDKPRVELDGDIPVEALEVLRKALSGQMTDSDAGDAIGEIRVRMAQAVKVKPL